MKLFKITSKVCCIVTDNGANICKAIRTMREERVREIMSRRLAKVTRSKVSTSNDKVSTIAATVTTAASATSSTKTPNASKRKSTGAPKEVSAAKRKATASAAATGPCSSNPSVPEKRKRGRPRKQPIVPIQDKNEIDTPLAPSTSAAVSSQSSLVLIESDSEDENVEVDPRFADIESDITGLTNDGMISVGDILDTGICRDVDSNGVEYEYRRGALPIHIRCTSHTLNLLATTDFQKVLSDRPALETEYKKVIGKLTDLWGKHNRSSLASDKVFSVFGNSL